MSEQSSPGPSPPVGPRRKRLKNILLGRPRDVEEPGGEPKVATGKRTMVLMAVSLAVTAAGIILAYLLMGVRFEEGKTMNAVLVERFAGGFTVGGVHVGYGFVLLTLVAEALLLFVAAQAGFIDGPRVMANMATDSYLPHRFAQLSDRLTMQNGVLLMGGASLLALIYTRGDLTHLVVMYSINVFVTFSEALELCTDLGREFPRSLFFAGKLIFEKEHWYQRVLHNETAYQLQRRFQFAGLNAMVLPVRILSAAPA
jgi:hypothetical protein